MNVKSVTQAPNLTCFTNQVHAQAFDEGKPCLVWIDAMEASARTPELANALRIAMLEGRKNDVTYVLCTRTLEGLGAILGLAATHIVMPGAGTPRGGIEALKISNEALKAIRETHNAQRTTAFVVRDGRTMQLTSECSKDQPTDRRAWRTPAKITEGERNANDDECAGRRLRRTSISGSTAKHSARSRRGAR